MQPNLEHLRIRFRRLEPQRRSYLYLHGQSRSLRHDNADLPVTGSWVVSFVSRERVGFLGVLESPVKTIYIGDSPCDLDALMAADTGMIKRDSEDELRGEQPELKRTVGQLAFGTSWVGKKLEDGKGVDGERARLWGRGLLMRWWDGGILGPGKWLTETRRKR